MRNYRTDKSEEEFESADEGSNNGWTNSIDNNNEKKINVNHNGAVSENNTSLVQITNDLNSVQIQKDIIKQTPLSDTEKKNVASASTKDWSIWPTFDTKTGINQKTNDRLNSVSLKKDPQYQDSSSPPSSSAHSDNDSSSLEEKSSDRYLNYQQRKKYRKNRCDPNNDDSESNKVTTRPSRETTARDDKSTNNIKKHHNVHEARRLLDHLSEQSPTRTPSWGQSWSNIGSFLSNAKSTVNTLKSSVSEGFSAVIESVESSLGAPDPEQLAEMNRMAFKIKGETSDSETEEPDAQQNQQDSVTNQGGWLSSLSIDKITTTGMQIVSGSLDVLETVGKKTFEAINEVDPELKGTRHLLKGGQQDSVTLSEIIRETQQQGDNNDLSKSNHNSITFTRLFEKNQGLTHLEALESLSSQASIKVQTFDYRNNELLEKIAVYFDMENDKREDDSSNNEAMNNIENQIPNIDDLSFKFTTYQTQLRSTVSMDKVLEVYQSAHEFIKEWDWMDTALDQKTLHDEAIDCLAILCSHIVEYYRKTAELFLMGCKSLTAFSVDVELLKLFQKQQIDFTNMLSGIPILFAKHMKHINNVPSNSIKNSETPVRCAVDYKHQLITDLFIQSTSSLTYAHDAYCLLKPVIQQSIIYHMSAITTLNDL
ncbi:unnamed protein product [Didymodactylos carnosus]|uniref:Protein FAM114A2 n=1 Tax=Didymodactylos carnosus TaxID=1234261 RepID=A0A814JMR7_9BILA|nr:unnamed protein product [Didymodactylos carnosus]CAF3810779.1 unnamed protein product [Didymodactylos carnosus]